ncbi:hypothetical protein RCL_jg8100.t1 [Rhizophagus clarus]|uniref:Uncharacterized protein n=1 Tax=Rhizophagus clarus TaxID=94130 RepID=A0A8H3R5C3_9GLOM|nr:hypothetical protein RCL_jg8100.t1 [Rhizophagus clarus]
MNIKVIFTLFFTLITIIASAQAQFHCPPDCSRCFVPSLNFDWPNPGKMTLKNRLLYQCIMSFNFIFLKNDYYGLQTPYPQE